MSERPDVSNEIALIERTINDNIKWPFPEKNVDRLLSSVSHEPDLLIFHPDSKSTVYGFADFKKMVAELFMDEEMKPTRTEIKDLRIRHPEGSMVAWFSCTLDDCGEYKGEKWEWMDARWTGVLEKRRGKWIIVQMHFSLPTDRQ